MEQRAIELVSDSSSRMARMGSEDFSAYTLAFGYGGAAHASTMQAQDIALVRNPARLPSRWGALWQRLGFPLAP